MKLPLLLILVIYNFYCVEGSRKEGINKLEIKKNNISILQVNWRSILDGAATVYTLH